MVNRTTIIDEEQIARDMQLVLADLNEENLSANSASSGEYNSDEEDESQDALRDGNQLESEVQLSTKDEKAKRKTLGQKPKTKKP